MVTQELEEVRLVTLSALNEKTVLIFFSEGGDGLKISGIDGGIFQDSLEAVDQDSFNGVFIFLVELLKTEVVGLLFETFLLKNVVKLH